MSFMLAVGFPPSDRAMDSGERSLFAYPARWMMWVGFNRRSAAAQAFVSVKSTTCDLAGVNGAVGLPGRRSITTCAPRSCSRLTRWRPMKPEAPDTANRWSRRSARVETCSIDEVACMPRIRPGVSCFFFFPSSPAFVARSRTPAAAPASSRSHDVSGGVEALRCRFAEAATKIRCNEDNGLSRQSPWQQDAPCGLEGLFNHCENVADMRRRAPRYTQRGH